MTTTFHIPDACCQPEVRDWTIDTILSRRPVTYAELDAIARSMPYKPYDQFNTITDTHKLWKFAIHEAGHSVIGIRGGGTMVYAGVFEEDNGKWMELIGLCRQKASPVRRAAQDNYLAAGYFAGQRWGNEPRRDFSETNDYEVLSRGRTPEEARKAWNAARRRLTALVKRDPTFEVQVKAVAAAMLRQEDYRLEGRQIEKIMNSVTRETAMAASAA